MTAPSDSDVVCPRVHELCGGDFGALMLVGLALVEIADGAAPADLDLKLARYAKPLAADGRLREYEDLRRLVEESVNREWRDAQLDFTDEQLDGQVLHTLFLLTRGVEPCRACFQRADQLSKMRPAGECEKHRMRAA